MAVQVMCWLAVAVIAVAAIGATGGNHSVRSTSTRSEPTQVPDTNSATKTTPGPTVPASMSSTPPLTAASPAAPSTVAGRGNVSASRGCRRGNPLADVYHPYRLQVQNPCMTVTGTVAYIRNEDDGDVHFNLSLPTGESRLLNQANYDFEHGQLVAEIVPADQPGCTAGRPPPLPSSAYRSPSYDYGICTGADIPTPPIGAQVSITGPYALDSDHGWMELHPVWSVAVLSTPSSPVTPASPPPASDSEPPPTAQPPSASSSAWCHATAAASNDGYTGDYEVYVTSNQLDTKATASDAGDTWSENTNSSGYANIRLYHTSAGMTITVTVGTAACSTTA